MEICAPSRLLELESIFLTNVLGVYIKIWDLTAWDAYKGQVRFRAVGKDRDIFQERPWLLHLNPQVFRPVLQDSPRLKLNH